MSEATRVPSRAGEPVHGSTRPARPSAGKSVAAIVADWQRSAGNEAVASIAVPIVAQPRPAAPARPGPDVAPHEERGSETTGRHAPGDHTAPPTGATTPTPTHATPRTSAAPAPAALHGGDTAHDVHPASEHHRHVETRRGGAPGTTTPGFNERNAVHRGKAVGAPGHAPAGPPRAPRRARSRPAPKGPPPRPKLDDPSLDAWEAATHQGAAAVGAANSTDMHVTGGELNETAAGQTARRSGATVDAATDATAHQPPIPNEAPKQQQLDTSEADAVIEAVARAGHRFLLEQSFAPVGSPPPYLGAVLAPGDFVPINLRTKQSEIEALLAGGLVDETQRVSLTRQLDALKARIAGIEENAGKATPEEIPVTFTDEGAAPLAPPDPNIGAILGDAIARAMLTVAPTAQQMSQTTLAAVHGEKVPAMKDLVERTVRPALEVQLRDELTGVARAAGVFPDVLQSKVAEQRELVAARARAAKEGVDAADQAAVTTRQAQAEHEQATTTGAKLAVQHEIAAKEAAASGPPDTAAIETTRDELLGKLRSTGGASLAALQATFTKRLEQLDRGAEEKKQKISQIAGTQAAAIRRHWVNEPERALMEARPTADWGSTEAHRVDLELKQLKESATSAHDRYAEEVRDQLQPGFDKIRDWAAHQVGRERTWWERLLDMIHDWTRQAYANNEAWEQQRNAETRTSMMADLAQLAALKRGVVEHNDQATNAAFGSLHVEQRVLANKYLSGGIDSIDYVAESMMLRIVSRRTPELADGLEQRAIESFTWEQLGQLARATNPGFNPRELANKIHSGVDRIGTDEAKVYAGLAGARTAVERAALDRAYTELFGSMRKDIEGDMEDEELDRANALMAGDLVMADAATIADAVAGLGTDEQAIRDVLRGKTIEELDAIKAAYRNKYHVELVADLRGDMRGAELDNALALASGDTDGADAAELEDAMRGPGTDEEKMERVYERIREEEQAYALAHGLTRMELDQRIRDRNGRVRARYTAMGYGDLQVNATSELESGDPLSKQGDLRVFTALQGGDATDIDAAHLVRERDGAYTSDNAVEKIIRNQRTEAEFEINRQDAVTATWMRSLDSSGDVDKEQVAATLAKLDQGSAANREERETRIQLASKHNILALAARYNDVANTGPGAVDSERETFVRLIDEGTSGWSRAEIHALVYNAGKLTTEDELFYSVRGLGTSKGQLDDALKGKTPKEIAALRIKYAEAHDGASLDDDVLGDLSGRDDLDVGLILQYGDPSTFVAQLADATPAERASLLAGFEDFLEQRRRFEMSDQEMRLEAERARRGAKPVDDDMRSLKQIADAVERARAFDTALRQAEADKDYDPAKRDSLPAIVAARANFDMSFQGAVSAQQELREQKDAFADLAAQVTGMVAGIAVAFLTAGAAAPALVALYSAAASAAMSMVTKASLKGNAYGWEDIGIDVAVGVVDGMMNYATAGLGPAVKKSLQAVVTRLAIRKTAEQAGEQLSERLITKFIRETVEEGITNGIQAVPSAFVGGVLNGEDALDALEGAGEASIESAKFGAAIHSGKTIGGAALGRATGMARRVGRWAAGAERPNTLRTEDVGVDLTPRQVSRQTGMTNPQLAQLHQFTRERAILVDIAPAQPRAAKMLRQGKALPASYRLQVSAVDSLDVRLGVPSRNLGKIALLRPDQIRFPPPGFEHWEPALQERVRDRFIQRQAEYFNRSADIDALVQQGAIHLEADGTIVNRNLLGTEEKVFVEDHRVVDMRQADGRPVEPEVYQQTMLELFALDVGISRESLAHTRIDANDPAAKEAYNTAMKPHEHGGDRPQIRFGEERPAVVVHTPYEMPEGSVFLTEGPAVRDRQANVDQFHQLMRSDPMSEFALVRNRSTGEYFVLQGNNRGVNIFLAEQMQMGKGPFDSIAHIHPHTHGLSYTDAAHRLPSGSVGDFGHAAGEVATTRESFRSEIHFTRENGTVGVTRYGIDIDDPRPYFVEVTGPPNERVYERFATVAEYHQWFQTNHGFPLGDVQQAQNTFDAALPRARAVRQQPRPGGRPSLAEEAAQLRRQPPPVPMRARRSAGSAAMPELEPISPTAQERTPRLAPDEEHAGWHPVVEPDHGTTIHDSAFPDDEVTRPQRRIVEAPPTSPADVPEPADRVEAGPSPDDAGHRLGTRALVDRYRLPVRTVDAGSQVAARHGVVIDLRARSATTERMLRSGEALSKPAELHLRPIDSLDVMLGVGGAENIDRIARFTPQDIALPADIDTLDPVLQRRLRVRAEQRRAEYFTSRDQIHELVTAGKIRVEPSGVIVNTGLVRGGGELPFVSDIEIFDIRQDDGRPASAKTKQAVVADLVRADVGIAHGPLVERNAQMTGSERDVLDELGEHHERVEPLARIGERGAQAVWNQPYEIPEGSILFSSGADALDEAANREYFKQTIRSDRHSEAALMLNADTGQYMVVQGNRGMVPTRDIEFLAIPEMPQGHWVLVAHSHPVEANGRTSLANHYPSGARADMGIVTYEALRTNQRATSEIHYVDAQGNEAITVFGMDPHNKQEPYFVIVPDAHGVPQEQRFTSIDHYHDFIRNTLHADPGEIAPGFAGPRGRTDASSEPTVDHRPVAPNTDNEPTLDNTVIDPNTDNEPTLDNTVIDPNTDNEPTLERTIVDPLVAPRADSEPTLVGTVPIDTDPTIVDAVPVPASSAPSAGSGMPTAHVERINSVLTQHRVVADMVPTPGYAEPLLREGKALARPAEIGLRPLDELDLLLGLGTAADLGTIGFFHQRQVQLPADFAQLDPDVRNALVARALERRAEYVDHGDQIRALVVAGRIRVEQNGIIVNTGLAGAAELPFTSDHEVFDLRTRDGRALDQALHRKVMDALVAADAGITRPTAYNNLPIDSAGSYDNGAFNARRSRFEEGGSEQLVRLGEDSTRVVWHEPYNTPEGSIFFAEGAAAKDHLANREYFTQMVRSEPGAEVALMHNTVTGEYLVMQGNHRGVPVGLAASMQPGGQWITIAHSHPVDATLGYTSAVGRIPSGATADMGMITKEVMRTGQAFESEIHFTRKGGDVGITRFGMDPHAEMPYFIEVPAEKQGTAPFSRRFATIDEYHSWVRRAFKIELGAVPNTFRGPRDESLVPRPNRRRARQRPTPAPGELGVRAAHDDETTIPTPGSVTPAKPPVTGPDAADVGTVVPRAELARRYGMPEQAMDAIERISAAHRVSIDVRPTSPHAAPLLAQRAALPRPQALRIEPIDEFDIMLGLSRRAYLGRVVLVDANAIVFPADLDQFALERRERLLARAELRRAEQDTARRDALELSAAGLIEIDPHDGLVVNTGLVDTGSATRRELPFTSDRVVAGIRSREDNRALLPNEHNAVIDDLVAEDIGVTGGAIEHWDDPAAARDRRRFEALVARNADPDRRPSLRFGDGDGSARVPGQPDPVGPRAVHREPYAIPSGSIYMADGAEALDAAGNRSWFHDLIRSDRASEFVLMRNLRSGEYCIMQGGSERSPIRLIGALNAELGGPRGRWVIEAHSHPTPRRATFVADAQRVPSGADGDMGIVAREVLLNGQSFHSEIHYLDEHGNIATTHFGIDAGDHLDPRSAREPYYLFFTRADGTSEAHRFATIEAYHRWYETTFPGHSLGPIPDTYSGPEHAWDDADITQDIPLPRTPLARVPTAPHGPEHTASAAALEAKQRRQVMGIPEVEVLVADRIAARTPLGDVREHEAFKAKVREAADAYARLPRTPGNIDQAAISPYEDAHAERQAAANRWKVPLAAQRVLCMACWRWFRDFARDEETTQYVADPSGVHVFGADGSYWLEPHPFGPRR